VRAELAELGVKVPFRVSTWRGYSASYTCGTGISMSLWRSLQVYLPGGEEAFKSTLRHEIGHVFEEHNRDKLVRLGLEKVFGDMDEGYTGYEFLVAPFSCAGAEHVTSYARTHPAEDFADTFRYVVENGIRDIDRYGEALRRKILFVRRAMTHLS
jgi:hypothetical protein